MARSKQGHCVARAALAGNPSDLHGGAVLAIPVDAFSATVALHDDEAPSGLALIDAALARVGETRRAAYETTIPRAVGLAGSSALVIAALRATGKAPDDPLALAHLALAVERDDLGIVAGLQDRATQAFGVPVLVDIGHGRVRAITPQHDLRFVVAYTRAAAADSGDYHRTRDPNPAGMAELARIARGAADAFEAADVAALVAAMGESASVRDEIAPLPPLHDQLAAALRAVGLTPNSAGSGGAVVAVLSDLDGAGLALALQRDEVGVDIEHVVVRVPGTRVALLDTNRLEAAPNPRHEA